MTKLTLLALVLLATSTLATSNIIVQEVKTLWGLWKQINNKIYTFSEETHRFEIFVKNYLLITSENAKNDNLKLALNKFADLTEEEFSTQVIGNGFHFDQRENEILRIEQEAESHIDCSVLALPDKWDWREKGAVTPVKNQGNCGSCWAFSATGALEGLHFVKNHTLVSLSEQHLVDCDKSSGGCNGGFPWYGFTYAAKNGIETEEDYPYEAANKECRLDKEKALHVNNGFSQVKIRNAEALKTATVQQPVSVGVRADQAAFRFYKSGVVKTGCGVELNHGVLVVGWDTFNGDEAFIVKNSWGEAYGDKGYVKVSTDPEANLKAGVCGILLAPTVPTL